MAMFENIGVFFKRFMQNDKKELLAENPASQSKETAKDRLHIVLMQDRANVSADFLELMKEEIIEVIKKYIVVDESKIDVRLTNEENEDGSIGAPILLANIPILNIRNDLKGELYNSNNHTVSEAHEENIDFTEKTQIVPVIKEVPEAENNETKSDENIVEEKEEIALENEKNDEEKVDEIFEENQNEENTIVEVEENKEETVVENVEEIDVIEVKEENENINEDGFQETEDNKQATETMLEDEIDELEDDYDDDDDVTFDDLLKAAEAEEERLKQLEENNEKKSINEKEEKKTKSIKSKATTRKKTSKGKKNK